MNILLTEILNTREARAARQQALLREHHCAVVFFTMNIAGLRLYRELGISGIRGEMAQGLPSVPILRCPFSALPSFGGLTEMSQEL